jgi:hypothetical protein
MKRRQALQSAAAAVTLLPVAANAQPHHAAAAKPARPYKAKWLASAEMGLLAEVTELILPRTDTPGAADARVNEYIDYALQSDKKRQSDLRAGLRRLAKVKADARADWLAKASERPGSPDGRFFAMLKDLTIDGYYQSQEGLVQELGWHGNTYLPEFKGCTHPEHQG